MESQLLTREKIGLFLSLYQAKYHISTKELIMSCAGWECAFRGGHFENTPATHTKELNQSKDPWEEDSEVSNSKSTFCNIYFKTLMDSDKNVNYNTVVHKDSRNRRRDILIRAWAQTLSARPRNKKKSRETDSSPGGVGC